MEEHVPHPDRRVVIDAGAVIKMKRVDRFGGQLFTTAGVLGEVKDEAARAFLASLPEEIKTREPASCHVAFVKNFAKGTGDLGFLSANDIELIALTVELQREAGLPVRRAPQELALGDGQISSWSPPKVSEASATEPASDSAAPPDAEPLEDGWEVPKPSRRAKGRQVPNKVAAEPVDGAGPLITETDALTETAQVTAELVQDDGTTVVKRGEKEQEHEQEKRQEQEQEQEQDLEEQEQEQEEECSDGSDTGGPRQYPSPWFDGPPPDEEEDDWSEDGEEAGEWITRDNLHRFGVGVEASEDVLVTCASADYSVQNVLLQMGITPLTFDGYAVRNVKLWGLVCRGCFHFMRDTRRLFCAKCGQATVMRVPIIVGEDGQPKVMDDGRRMRVKGAKYSCPAPRGGRGWKPVFAEDELMMGNRARELRHQERVYEKERKLRDPFNDSSTRGWHSRGTTGTGQMIHVTGAAPRVQVGYGRKNPNANNFRFRNKK